MKITSKKTKEISNFIKEITSEGFITALAEDFMDRCGEEFLQNSIDEISEEISITLNFSYSDVIGSYLYQNYSVASEAGESLSEEDQAQAIDQFITEVVELNSPFDHPVVSEDDELFDALKLCASLLKQTSSAN